MVEAVETNSRKVCDIYTTSDALTGLNSSWPSPCLNRPHLQVLPSRFCTLQANTVSIASSLIGEVPLNAAQRLHSA